MFFKISLRFIVKFPLSWFIKNAVYVVLSSMACEFILNLCKEDRVQVVEESTTPLDMVEQVVICIVERVCFSN